MYLGPACNTERKPQPSTQLLSKQKVQPGAFIQGIPEVWIHDHCTEGTSVLTHQDIFMVLVFSVYTSDMYSKAVNSSICSNVCD